MAETDLQRKRWINYAAGLWALAFAAPHLLWALGFTAGFPGGPANHHLFMRGWRYFFDVLVVLLSFIAVFLALALIRPWPGGIRFRLLRIAAWIACAMLSLRGVAGAIADGLSDPVWWPTFLTGGILFGCVAWLARSADS